MTLIVKELIVRGIVSNDQSGFDVPTLTKEQLDQYLEQMRKEIERECIEKVLQKIETRTIR